MRSFIITVLLFILVCAVIVINNNYIRSSAEYIAERVSEEYFEENPERAISELEDFWKKNHPMISMSVGFKELDRMSDLIIDLKTYHMLGIDSEVVLTRVMIVETADEISRLERFGLENLI
ncbi:MAG: DUF4363 family protein [Clostridia bacterium]|nr:DUF4363 family protein [Clostridia bacterium]